MGDALNKRPKSCGWLAVVLGCLLGKAWSPCGAQNLVLNGSFEEYDTCPDNGNQMDRALGWSAYRASPDYFNACDTADLVSVPINFAGYRFAADGTAYAGVLTWAGFGPGNQREHFGSELQTALIPGVPVHLSFKVTAAWGGIQQDWRWSVDGVGVRFLMQAYFQNNSHPLPNSAALHVTTAPVDTAQWTQVSGTYVPDSAYRYLVIGGFFEDDLLSPVQFNPSGNTDRAYALVDDVCVAYDPMDCGLDVGIERSQFGAVKAFPNPFNEILNIHLTGSAGSGAEIWLHDVMGRWLRKERIAQGRSSVTMHGSDLPDGFYVVSGRTSNGPLAPFVVVRVSP